MKRGAESQLTKEEMGREGGDVEPESTSETGFKKAPDEILKTRVIRGLPNRTKPSGGQSNSTNGTTASPLFPSSVASSSSSPFALPSPAATSNPFASSATNSSDSMNTSRSSPFGKFDTQPRPFGTFSQTSSPFNSTSQTAPPTTFTFQSDKLVSSASSTVKAFASVLNNSDSNILGSPAPNNLSSSSNQPAATDEEDSVLFKYYINLRGLNHSLLDAISKGIEDDPFADMSGFLESYRSTYVGIQKEMNDASAVSKPESSSNSTPKPSSNLFSMPAAASPFGKSPAQEAKSPFPAPVVSSTPSSTSTSLFSPPSAGVQPFTFGGPAQKPSLFNPPEQTSPATTTSAFGSSPSPFKFGGSINQSSPSIFGSTKPASTFKWGATDQSTTGDLIGASDKSSTTPTPPPTSNAVHFQFGSGSGGIAQSQTKPAISTDAKTTDDAAEREGSEPGTSATEGGGESSGSPSNLLAVHNPHDDEGEGEENEISVHAIKVKAYRMRKADAKEGLGWADLGFGILRLKKDKDTSARRMLLRNSTNGKILINFKIYPGLKPSLAKNALSFVGHDNGVSQTYCVRLPGEEQAQRLKEALDKEIESVTAKDKE